MSEDNRRARHFMLWAEDHGRRCTLRFCRRWLPNDSHNQYAHHWKAKRGNR